MIRIATDATAIEAWRRWPADWAGPIHNIHKEHAMKRLFTLCLALCMGTAFVVGCDKKAEVKTEKTTTDESGTTTETHVDKIETSK
jgi:hypothetical protein